MAKFKIGDKVKAAPGYFPDTGEGTVTEVGTASGFDYRVDFKGIGGRGAVNALAVRYFEIEAAQPVQFDPPEDKVVSKPLQVGDKVKTSAGFVGEVVGFAVDGKPPVLVRAIDGWRNGHNGSGTELLPGHGEVAMRGFMGGYWFFEPEGLELISDEKPKAEKPKKVENILEEALRVTGGDRRRDYGSAKVNHDRIALLWAAWDVISSGSDEEIAAALSVIRPLAPESRELDSARDVAMKMILLKIAREANTPKRDNKVDIAGYARCLSQIDGEEGEF